VLTESALAHQLGESLHVAELLRQNVGVPPACWRLSYMPHGACV